MLPRQVYRCFFWPNGNRSSHWKKFLPWGNLVNKGKRVAPPLPKIKMFLIMAVEIITKEDLQQFRRQLLDDLREMLQPRQAAPAREVLRSAEVRRLLKISPATLQTLRISGTLPYVKIGGTLYYHLEDINKLLTGKE